MKENGFDDFEMFQGPPVEVQVAQGCAGMRRGLRGNLPGLGGGGRRRDREERSDGAER